MSFSDKRLSPDRVQISESLSVAEVDELLADVKLRVLQASSAVDSRTWDLLNDRFCPRRPDVQIRVYGFCGPCDLAFVRRLGNVRHFAADCLMHATGVEHLAALGELESLSIGIFDLESFDFLERLSTTNLHDLSLLATKSKKPTLAPLARFDQLRQLFLEGQQKDIEVIAGLPMLEDLTLRSITINDFGFLRSLSRLWSLDIKLGGSRNLAALDGMTGIKYLELWQVRGLDDLSVISTLTGLQYLFLQSLPRVSSLPDLSRLKALRRVYLENMTGLTDLRALASAPVLEEFMHVSARGMEPHHYLDLLKKPTLRRLLVGFGSAKKNDLLANLADQAGIKPFEGNEFVFT